jgi:hypothetical protein
MFRDLVHDCIVTSQKHANIPAPTGSHFFASTLFTLLCSRSVSLLKFIPLSISKNLIKEPWDYGTIAVLTRALLEVRLAFFYLGAEAVTPEEWDCRWNILCLHDCTARKRLFEVLPSTDDESPNQVEGFTLQAQELGERLAANSYFAALSPGQQRRYLNGGEPYLSSLEDIALRSGTAIGHFKMFYRLLSAQVHALPFSFFRMDEGDRGRGEYSEVEEGHIELCLSFACHLLASSRDEMNAKFADSAA